jgi:glycogen(starch) synthase
MGGMGEQCRQVMRALEDEDIYFDIIGSDEEDASNGPNYSFRPFKEIKTASTVYHPLAKNFLSQLPIFAESVKSDKPDIVHAFDWSSFHAGLYVAKHWDVPCVSTMQLSIQQMMRDGVVNEENKELYDINAWIEFLGMVHSNRIIQVSNDYASRFPGLFGDKTRVIGNGILIEDYKSFSRVDLPGNNPFKIVYIGRFDWMKNITGILETKIPQGIDFIVIGSKRGSSPALLGKVIERSDQDDNFFYVGPKYGQEKVDWLCSADAQIVPSLHEPFGIVALEALAANNILLSSFKGGMTDFLDEGCAINCGITGDSISNAMQQAQKMSFDEKAVMKSRGMQVCKNWTWKKQAQKLLQVYKELI